MIVRLSKTAPRCLIWLVALLIGAAGCGREGAKSEPAGVQPPKARVTVVKPRRKSLRHSVTRPAQIEAFDVAHLYAKLPAYVDKYLVDIGDAVRGPRVDDGGKLAERGQLLAELSAPELDQDLRQKKAMVAQANADVEQAQAAVKVSRADATSAQAQLAEATAAIERFEAEYARWTSEYDRVVQLVSKSAVTQKLADETKAQMLAAKAARKEAQAKVESARAAVSAAEAKVEKTMADEAAVRARRDVAEADEARAAALVNYLRIEAPFDGTITARHADIGMFAQPPGNAEARPLFTVVRSDRVRVFIDLPELDATLADKDDSAVVRVQSLAGREFPGSVTRTSWSLDAATRTLRTEVDVPNPDGSLRPGMYAQVTIDLAVAPNACVVPAAAVISRDDGTWCFVVEQGKAARKPVTLGLKAGGEVAIASGLSDGQSVIVGQGASLTDGQAVEIAEAAPAK
jgi:RND family efflux transporter MFP subunit